MPYGLESSAAFSLLATFYFISSFSGFSPKILLTSIVSSSRIPTFISSATSNTLGFHIFVLHLRYISLWSDLGCTIQYSFTFDFSYKSILSHISFAVDFEIISMIKSGAPLHPLSSNLFVSHTTSKSGCTTLVISSSVSSFYPVVSSNGLYIPCKFYHAGNFKLILILLKYLMNSRRCRTHIKGIPVLAPIVRLE